jgi:hypothetical protein
LDIFKKQACIGDCTYQAGASGPLRQLGPQVVLKHPNIWHLIGNSYGLVYASDGEETVSMRVATEPPPSTPPTSLVPKAVFLHIAQSVLDVSYAERARESVLPRIPKWLSGD